MNPKSIAETAAASIAKPLKRKSGVVAAAVYVLFSLLVLEQRALAADPKIRVAKGRYVIESFDGSLSSSSLSSGELIQPRVESLDEAGHFSAVSSGVSTRSVAVEIVEYDGDNSYCDSLLQSGAVKACSPDFVVEVSATPNDSRLSEQWAHVGSDGIGSLEAWSTYTGGTNTVIAVLDSGVDYNHPDLVDNMWRNPFEVAGNGIDDDANGYIDDIFGMSGVTGNGNPMDDNSHGTHCAGIIGARANNGAGVAGVNWVTKIMALKFIRAEGYGFISDAIKALEYMNAMKRKGVPIRVVSNSWGGGGYSQPLVDAIKNANELDIVFVAAAGNSALDNDLFSSYPSSVDVPNVVAVAALDRNFKLASYSNYGPFSVDIGAPGSSILSTVPNNQYEFFNGTSMATPYVAGALNLLASREPSLSGAQLIERLYATAVPRPEMDGIISSGRVLNVKNLLNNTRPPATQPRCDCDYSIEEIPFGPDRTVTSGTRIAPYSGSYMFAERVSLPFTFPYYGRGVNQVGISPNGVINMLGELNSYDSTGYPVPGNESIDVLHANLRANPSQLQGIYYRGNSTRFDIYWLLSPGYNVSAGNIEIWATLYPNGKVETHIALANQSVQRIVNYNFTMGLRGDSVPHAITYSYNGVPFGTKPTLGLRYTPARSSCTNIIVSPPTPQPSPTPTPQPSPTPTPDPSGGDGDDDPSGPDDPTNPGTAPLAVSLQAGLVKVKSKTYLQFQGGANLGLQWLANKAVSIECVGKNKIVRATGFTGLNGQFMTRIKKPTVKKNMLSCVATAAEGEQTAMSATITVNLKPPKRK